MYHSLLQTFVNAVDLPDHHASVLGAVSPLEQPPHHTSDQANHADVLELSTNTLPALSVDSHYKGPIKMMLEKQCCLPLFYNEMGGPDQSHAAVDDTQPTPVSKYACTVNHIVQ